MAKHDPDKKRALLNLLSELAEVIENGALSGKEKEVAISNAEARTVAKEEFTHEEQCQINDFLVALEEHFLL